MIALHGLTALVIGVIAFVGANDPGWRDVQRLVVVMMISLWAGGIALSAVAARNLVSNHWIRLAILAVGPLSGIAFLVAKSTFGL